MTEKLRPDDLRKEYRFFLESPRSNPPSEVSTRIKQSLRDDLNPAAFKVFCKLFAIHFISGTLTLFLCPQLGITLGGDEASFLTLFTKLGEYGCAVACGAMFLGGTGLIAAFLLRSQEVRVIKQTRALQLVLLAFLSLGFLLSVGENERAIPFGLMTAWVAGALLGGVFTFQLGWLVRDRVRHSL